jgi:hypothetical protein
VDLATVRGRKFPDVVNVVAHRAVGCRFAESLEEGGVGACQAESQHRDEGDRRGSERPFPPSTMAGFRLGAVSRREERADIISNYPSAALELP